MFRKVTGEQVRAARALLKMTQQDLSDITSLSPSPLAALERDIFKSRESSRRLVVMILEDQGIEFVNEENGRVGVIFDPAKVRNTPE